MQQVSQSSGFFKKTFSLSVKEVAFISNILQYIWCKK